MKHRTALMGIATCLIFLCHFIYPNKILQLIQGQGIIGVDIFLFLSGFGLVHSYKKNNILSQFYKKRLNRILPTFLLVIIIYLIVAYYIGYNFSILQVGLIASGLGYWLKTDYYLEWYTPAILLLYAFFPLLYTIIKKNRFVGGGRLIIGSLLLCIMLLATNFSYQPFLFFFLRIPIFLFGIYTAIYSQKISTPFVIILVIAAIVLTLLSRLGWVSGSGTWIFRCSLCAIPLMFLLLNMLERVTLFTPLFEWIGRMSYELFLVQLMFLRLKLYNSMSILIMCTLIVCSAFLIHYSMKYLSSAVKPTNSDSR